MTEQQPKSEARISGRSLWEVLADLEPAKDSDNFTPYLKYLQQNVTVEQFLADRLAQANTDVVLGDLRREKNGNPNPIVEIKTPRTEEWGEGVHYEYNTFMLSGDVEHLYFISDGWPGDEESPYLGPEDIIPFDNYSWDRFPKHRGMVPGMDFNKPVERVPIAGGEAERFNYLTNVWELSGLGVAEPTVSKGSFRKTLVDKLFRRN